MDSNQKTMILVAVIGAFSAIVVGWMNAMGIIVAAIISTLN